MRRCATALCAAIVLLGIATGSAAAFPRLGGSTGELDRSFGNGGVAEVAPSQRGFVSSIAIDAQGRIVVATRPLASRGAFMTSRLLPSGAMDSSFGGGDGVVTTKFQDEVPPSWTGSGDNEALVVRVDRQGRILVGGLAGNAEDYGALVRYLEDGTPDPDFGGGDGRQVYDLGPRSCCGTTVSDIEFDSHDRIVFTISRNWQTGTVIARALPDGTLDESFSDDGWRSAGVNGRWERAYVDVTADDRIWVTTLLEQYVRPQWYGDIHVARFDTEGDFDPSMSGDGIARISLAGDERILGAGLDPLGRLLVGGMIIRGDLHDDLEAVRILPNGALDPSYGAGGRTTTTLPESASIYGDATVDQYGRLMIETDVHPVKGNGGPNDPDYAIARYGLTGRLDPEFGFEGIFRGATPGGPGSQQVIAFDPEHDVIMGGGKQFPDGHGNAFVSRYRQIKRCNGVKATITGGRGRDFLRGTPKRDVIYAGGGRDVVRGATRNDLVCGGSGSDLLGGGGGGDNLFGDSGPDLIRGGRGNDRIKGGPGRDRIRGGRGRDRIRGGGGRDHTRQ